MDTDPAVPGTTILSNGKGNFGRNDREDWTGLQRYSQIFRSDRNETVRSI